MSYDSLLPLHPVPRRFAAHEWHGGRRHGRAVSLAGQEIREAKGTVMTPQSHLIPRPFRRSFSSRVTPHTIPTPFRLSFLYVTLGLRLLAPLRFTQLIN